MKKRTKTKPKKKAGLDRQSIIVLSFMGFAVLAILAIQIDKILPNSFGLGDDERLPNELVCMVNDAYMGVEQIPVPVNNKTYYGCCQMCVTKLKTDRSARMAIDPYSGEEVDKSEAYIVLETAGADDVLYFKNRQNYTKYREVNE